MTRGLSQLLQVPESHGNANFDALSVKALQYRKYFDANDQVVDGVLGISIQLKDQLISCFASEAKQSMSYPCLGVFRPRCGRGKNFYVLI
jgi:hypothetical protein